MPSAMRRVPIGIKPARARRPGHFLAAPLLAALLVGSLLVPTMARADGDPASDVLQSQRAFLPADAGISSRQSATVTALLTEAQKAGFPIRVAVIPDPYDLGYVTQLWRRPGSYAEFLDIELSLVFKGPVLVVMPNGFGFHWVGHSSASAESLLSRIAIAPGGAGLANAARLAVRRLAAANGVALGSSPASDPTAAKPSNDGIPLAILAVVVIAVAILFGLGLRMRARRAGTAALPAEPRAPAPAGSPRPAGAMPRWFRYALPALALLAAVDLGVLILASGASHAPTASKGTVENGAIDTANVSPEVPPIRWPEGRQPAPDFTLTDQDGRPVSLAAYRGHPVIVTFIDPLCRELCPLAAQVLSKVDDQLPTAERPEILAVSVDVYANQRANLLQDFSKWSLTPNWLWAVGSPSQLAKVWKDYYAEVDVTNRRIAGTTVHYITHSEIAYLIDARGYERELFGWPYGAKRVESAIESLQ